MAQPEFELATVSVLLRWAAGAQEAPPTPPLQAVRPKTALRLSSSLRKGAACSKC